MHDAGIGTEFLDISGHAVIEACTHCYQHIAVMHRHVGFIGTVHPQHTDELRIGCRVGAKSHQGVRNGEIQLTCKLCQCSRGIAEYDAAAGIQHRTLGAEHQLHGTLDLTGMSNVHRVVGTHADPVRVAEHRLFRGYVLGDVNDNRPGPPGRGDIERLLDGLGQPVDILHQEVVLDAGPGDADVVGFLERVIADQVRRDLPGEHHHRYRIHVGGGNAGHGVGRTGPGSHDHDTGPAGGTRIAVCRVSCSLLVAHQDMLDLVLVIKSVVDVQNCTAGVTEDVFDTFSLQRAHKYFRASQFHQYFSRGHYASLSGA